MKIYNTTDFMNIFESKKISNIVNALENNYCEFYYTKQNGDKRHAFGTLKPAFLETVWEPSEEHQTSSDDCIVYWDIVKKAFRQFHPDAFIKFVNKIEKLKDFIEEYPKLENKINKAKSNFKKEE